MDIREILAALTPEDRILWSQHRTEMRKSYLNAHNSVIGIVAWDYHDDAFLDLIDIKLALIFDRAGRFETVKDIIGSNDKNIEEAVIKQETSLNNNPTIQAKIDEAFKSPATAMMQDKGWTTDPNILSTDKNGK